MQRTLHNVPLVGNGPPLVGQNPTKPLLGWFDRLQIRLGLMRAPAKLPIYDPLQPLATAERSVKILQLERHLRSHGGLRLASAWLVDLSFELASVKGHNEEMQAVLRFKEGLPEYLAKHPAMRSMEGK
jgi:hypothetical protein